MLYDVSRDPELVVLRPSEYHFNLFCIIIKNAKKELTKTSEEDKSLNYQLTEQTAIADEIRKENKKLDAYADKLEKKVEKLEMKVETKDKIIWKDKNNKSK